MNVRDTYKYVVKRGRTIVYRSITDDLERRACLHKAEYPDCRVSQVGRKTTRQAALRWERQFERKRKPISKRIEVASLPTENYREVIEIGVPTRFYWNPDGTFDGIEFGPFKTKLLPWQEDMMVRCLDAVRERLHSD